MRGVELVGADAAIAVFGMFLMFISFAVRLYIFLRLKDDRSIQALLADASIIGFPDLLAFRLVRLGSKLSSQAKAPVLAFFSTQLFGMLLLVFGVFHATIFKQ